MARSLRYRVTGRPADGPDGCHSLIVRLGRELAPAAVVARARTLNGGRAVPLRLWHERFPFDWEDPVALARVRDEARRPLHPSSGSPRAFLAEFRDGSVVLVLVARRDTHCLAELRDLARALTRGARACGLSAPVSAAEPVGVLDDQATDSAPEWGLGDPGARRRRGEVAIELSATAVPDEVLVAAVAITTARHGGLEQVEVALWRDERRTGELWVHRVDCGERWPVRDHLGQYADVADAAPAAPVRPRAAVVIEDERPGERYLPFLAPPLSPLVHWRRSDDGRVSGTLSYRERDIAPAIARDFAAHLRHVAEQLASAPEGAVGELELIEADEARTLLNAGATRPAPGRAAAVDTIPGLLTRIAVGQPDAVAVVDEHVQLSYAELRRRAGLLARGLAALGAGPGDLVGIALERSADLIVAALGALMAGCAYLPMDLRYPADRLRYLAGHARVVMAIGYPRSLPELAKLRIVTPEELLDAGDPPAEPPSPPSNGAAPAYVIYTSGSTGHPKGVVVPHRNVAALIEAARAGFDPGARDTWTFFHSCAFDFSVWEIWGCLLTGGRLVVVPHWVTRDTGRFYELVERQGVTVLSQTPSAFAQFNETDAGRRGRLALRLVIFGGEALDVGMLASWFTRHPGTSCKLTNMYGITETTVHVTEQAVTPAEAAAGTRSVGRPLPGWSVTVRDGRGRVLPAGITGEIYVGGAGVALGYLHQPALTAERFLPGPGGDRVYRSGDLGRIRPDGRLDHLGRMDNQVKVRGHRIELDEIRGVLLGHASVAAAAVLLRRAVAGDRDTARLDAYYVVRHGRPVTAGDLRAHLAGLLPGYMLPATFTPVDSIPLTGNGKADLAAFPAPVLTRAAEAAPAEAAPAEAAPAGADPTAATVLAIWERLLNTAVRPEDNFFELGGNSLLVVRLLRELSERGLPRVPVKDFYRNSVAARFIELVRDASSRPVHQGDS